ncbi:type I-E CRISPR-associated protein Cas6/Cse3/CasE [Propionivibrio sp.]|uniref:type I-E CRISPR-associated protein Cas6/Cse3/CasE n=1 Tax=Propionivibrio sp. TaxID=2212460 RepID=UPI0025F58238|nr:type I-E CRISPR-associated protein Cas6/Cse3/CasE [Propionivibrio sp.]
MADPYQLHSTLCRAFSTPDKKCPENTFLWRLEPEADPAGCPRILVQSRVMADWEAIGIDGWLLDADAPINLMERLKLNEVRAGQRFRFRLRANPSVTRNGKRQGLLHQEEQEHWLVRKEKLHGFSLPRIVSFDFSESSPERCDVQVSHEQMLSGKQHSGNAIRVYSVLFNGVLSVSDPDAFRVAIESGIGHGKALGLGLLSVVPVR